MARIPVMSVSASINDPVAVMNTYCSYVSMFIDPVAKEESKLKALPELSGELETIISDPQYPSFLDQAIKIFIRILGDEEPQFIAEKTTHVCIFMSCQWIILYILICKMRKTLVVFRIIIEFHKATMQCGECCE
nr:transcription-associated protein 1-like isoform X2 [Parasteatoda tepidariorum]